MHVEELKRKTEADIAAFISKKIADLKKRMAETFPIFSLPPARK